MSESRSKLPQSFRLNPSVIELLDIMAANTGMSKTAIMEKALIDYSKRYDSDLEMDIREQVNEIYELVKKISLSND